MSTYEAPAKLNLSLHIEPPRRGLHPLLSMAQTIEWCDRLDLAEREGNDCLEVLGEAAEQLDVDDNLVLKALDEARRRMSFPAQSVTLSKELPVASGLGGGSSDAAAALLAAADASGLAGDDLPEIAARIGADVALFLTGGTLMMSGFGERIEPFAPLEGVGFAVVVPEFGLSTADVYARWDSLEGPFGEPVPDDHLPPGLRGEMPMRNDLLPAALDLEPRLGDFIADIRGVWGTSVSMTGSGSACFGYFTNAVEATDAAAAVNHLCSIAKGVDARNHGVARV